MIANKKAPFIIKLEQLLDNCAFDIPSRIRILNLLRNKISKGDYCFPWRMENNLFVGISNHEVLSKYGVGANCYRTRKWESHVEAVIRKVVKSGQVALDIGANIGYFSSVLAEVVKDAGRVYAFEPVDATFQQLKLTKEANRFSNLDLFNCGLGDKAEELLILFDRNISGNSSLYERNSLNMLKQPIQITTLDMLYGEERIALCDFIKIDVEGHEIRALKGGLKYLRESCPLILYEFNAETARLADYSLAEFIRLTKEISPGYEHYLIWGDGYLLQIDLEYLKVPVGCYLDFLAIPAKRLSEIQSLIEI
jgi:FkbM family methyltransferase